RNPPPSDGGAASTAASHLRVPRHPRARARRRMLRMSSGMPPPVTTAARRPDRQRKDETCRETSRMGGKGHSATFRSGGNEASRQLDRKPCPEHQPCRHRHECRKDDEDHEDIDTRTRIEQEIAAKNSCDRTGRAHHRYLRER